VLHVTNGDAAVDILLESGVHGDILPWRDVLHEGPVDASLALETLSARRAQFIAACGWGELAELEMQFRERDERLKRAAADDEVVLWFEHDLYDQLQLVQLLAWFADHPHPRLTLVCEPEYLGIMEPERAAALFVARRPVRLDQLRTAQSAWKAFGSSDPASLQKLDVKALPFLSAALRRLLQEYPWLDDGLSRLEREVVDALEFGPLGFQEIFRAIQEREDPIFLGDTVVQWHLERMAREGLVQRHGEQWLFLNLVKTRFEPRWIGGVRLEEGSPWRWNPRSARLVRLG